MKETEDMRVALQERMQTLETDAQVSYIVGLYWCITSLFWRIAGLFWRIRGGT